MIINVPCSSNTTCGRVCVAIFSCKGECCPPPLPPKACQQGAQEFVKSEKFRPSLIQQESIHEYLKPHLCPSDEATTPLSCLFSALSPSLMPAQASVLLATPPHYYHCGAVLQQSPTWRWRPASFGLVLAVVLLTATVGVGLVDFQA